jgi:hypothetical protein
LAGLGVASGRYATRNGEMEPRSNVYITSNICGERSWICCHKSMTYIVFLPPEAESGGLPPEWEV